MAKKILAVVLAVMLAVSAMAVSAFADDIKIKADPQKSEGAKKSVVTITVEANPLYGALTNDDALNVTLPDLGTEAEWKITYGGKDYDLTKVNGELEVTVLFRQLSVKFTDGVIILPNTTTTLQDTVKVEFKAVVNISDSDAKKKVEELQDNDFAEWMKGEESMAVKTIKDCGFEVKADNGADSEWIEFVAATFEKGVINPSNNANAALLTWDHTLANYAILSNPEAEFELTVNLKDPIIGRAMYTLYVIFDDYNDYRPELDKDHEFSWTQAEFKPVGAPVYVDSVADGESTTLTFKIPAGSLYDWTYGTFADRFVIAETVTLRTTDMDSFTTVDPAKVAITDKGGEKAPIAWDKDGNVLYGGKKVAYAKNGELGDKGTVVATSITLSSVLPEAQAPDNVPTQDTNNENDPDDGEGDNMNVDDGNDGNGGDNGDEGKNPPTGIALAVLPMIVAAAAAVVSKKH